MRRPFSIAVALLLTLAACSSAGSIQDGYDLREFSIEGPAAASAGPSSLAISNSGVFPHTLVIADEAGTVVAATELIQPGETLELGVDLPPGEYQFTCRIVSQKPDGEIVDHFERGMVETVTFEG